jgi:1-acyl-sn-glycerol-3-phosphate acyltransferase
LDLQHYHQRARTRGVNPIVYWLTRAPLQLAAHLYWRISRIGREHIPQTGGAILVSNHRSFLDPFVIGLMTRRPVYYMAKGEIFEMNRLLAWFTSSLGAFPVRRGEADVDTIETARAILARGDLLVMFPEGTRTRPGALGKPKRGVGRLVLEAGVPVVPIALIGTEGIRKGWRIRPHKIRVRIGSPLTFPHMEHSSGPLAARVVDRIWPNIMLQWEWLGGLPPLRRAAVIGADESGTTIAAMFAKAGIEVDLGVRAADEEPSGLPTRVKPVAASALQLGRHDLVIFAVAPEELSGALAGHASGIAPRTAVLLVSDGLLEPSGVDAAECTRAWAVGVLAGPADPEEALNGAPMVLSTRDRALARLVGDALAAAGYDVTHPAAGRPPAPVMAEAA